MRVPTNQGIAVGLHERNSGKTPDVTCTRDPVSSVGEITNLPRQGNVFAQSHAAAAGHALRDEGRYSVIARLDSVR